MTGNTNRSQTTLQPASSPSKRMPVAALPQKFLTPPKIAAIAVLVLLAVVAALHVSGVWKIPGLR